MAPSSLRDFPILGKSLPESPQGRHLFIGLRILFSYLARLLGVVFGHPWRRIFGKHQAGAVVAVGDGVHHQRHRPRAGPRLRALAST